MHLDTTAALQDQAHQRMHCDISKCLNDNSSPLCLSSAAADFQLLNKLQKAEGGALGCDYGAPWLQAQEDKLALSRSRKKLRLKKTQKRDENNKLPS